jgi:hypothetical protein
VSPLAQVGENLDVSNGSGGPQGAQISMWATWRPHLLVFFATFLLSIFPLRGLIVSGIFLWWNSSYRSVDFVMDEARPNSGSPYIAGHIEGSTDQRNVVASLKDGVMVVKAAPSEAFAAGKRLPVWHSDTAPTMTVFGREVTDVPIASMPGRPGVVSFLISLVWFLATWMIGLRATAWVAARWSRSYYAVAGSERSG